MGRRRCAVIVAVIMALIGLTAVRAGADSSGQTRVHGAPWPVGHGLDPGFPLGYYFEIYDLANGKCVDARTQDSGHTVQMYPCFDDFGRYPNQFWYVRQYVDGYAELANAQFAGCLDAISPDGKLPAGRRLQVYPCLDDPSAHPNQYWYRNSRTSYGAVGNRASSSVVLTADAQTLNVNPGVVEMWGYGGTSNQLWAL